MAKGIVDPFIEEPDVFAFRALADGVASADQQKRVSSWLFNEACRVLADPYEEVKAADSTDVEHDVIFALGRRYVAVLMRKMLLPVTLERAKAATRALHPEATRTTPERKPRLQQRRATRGKPT